MRQSVVLIQAEAAAPAKPAVGARCNGCGLCCLTEPCPAGAVVSRRRTGVCAALRWDGVAAVYRCGLVSGAPGPLAWLARRWISAGSGCDADFEAVPQRAAEAASSAERGN